MNRTISTNLGGLVFQVDEDAYGRLESYLKSLERRFADESERKEILMDIESRIAELFQEHMEKGRNVVSMEDVQFAIERLGMPEDIEDSEAEPASNPYSAEGQKQGKRLFRDEDNSILGGVCSGVSAYFGIGDPIWVRILFVLGFFLSFSVTFWVYVILWILVPKAKTAAEKLQMRGEPVTVDNIERTIREEYQNLRSNMSSEQRRVHGRIKKGVHSSSQTFAKIFGIILVTIGSVGFVSTVVWMIIGVFTGEQNLYDLLGWVSPGPVNQFMLTLGAFLLSCLPLLAIFILGLKLLASKRVNLTVNMVVTAIFWIGGLVIISIAGYGLGRQFIASGSTTLDSPMENSSDTIRIEVVDVEDVKALESASGFSFIQGAGPLILDDRMIIQNVDFMARPSTDGQNRIKVIRKSQGVDRKLANAHARNIEYKYSFADNKLVVDDFLSFPKEDKIRAQEVEMSIYITPGTYVYMDPRAIESIGYHLVVDEDYERQWDPRTHLWLMTKRGLVCADCGYNLQPFLPPDPIVKKDSTISLLDTATAN
jgi:phage shock protein PspC (stress-responsive transcriptional regulator)